MEALETEIVEIKVLLGRIDERLKTMEESLKSTEKTLYGNGQPGIVNRVTKLEVKSSSAWATIKGIGSFILSLLSMIVAALSNIIK